VEQLNLIAEFVAADLEQLQRTSELRRGIEERLVVKSLRLPFVFAL
jgi:hypothetical protein